MNPRSRRHREGPGLAAELRKILGADGAVVEASTPEELREVARDFRRRAVDVLAVSGGDGTAGFALTVFADEYGAEPLPKLALLRGGTMNTVANGVGVPRLPPAWLLRSLAFRHARGMALRSSRRVTMRVRGETSPGRLGFLFGMGLGYGFLEEYYALGDPHPTHVTAAHTLSRIAASILVRGETAKRVVTPIEVAIEADGDAWPMRGYLTILAGTVEQVGLGFRPFFQAVDGSVGFHLVGVHGPAARVVAKLYRTRLGRAMGQDCAEDAFVTRARFACPGGAVPYFLDGDLFREEGELTVELGPRVRFVY